MRKATRLVVRDLQDRIGLPDLGGGELTRGFQSGERSARLVDFAPDVAQRSHVEQAARMVQSGRIAQARELAQRRLDLGTGCLERLDLERGARRLRGLDLALDVRQLVLQLAGYAPDVAEFAADGVGPVEFLT